jgi:adenosine deaminase
MHLLDECLVHTQEGMLNSHMTEKTENTGATAGAYRSVKITDDLLFELPKTDLHVHVDGSMRIPTLIELSKANGVELPSYDEAGLRELVFRERYASLVEYLHGFKYTCAALQTLEALEQVGYELAWDNINEGVCYFEPRFAPQLHMGRGRSFVDVVQAVNLGLERAKDEYNASPEVVAGLKPPFAYGIVVCAMRMFNEHFSEYYRQLMEVHTHAPAENVYGMASLELARAAVMAVREYGLPIVGFDLAGQENGYPASDHAEAYSYAHKNFLKKTVHAGEAYGPESIFQAITDLHADRIGHGYHLFSPWLIEDESVDKLQYINNLAEYIGDRRVTIEVCITSNLQTNPNLKMVEHHAFRQMMKHRLSATFCTDNRTISSTTVTREMGLAVKALHMNLRELQHYTIYGFKRSFFPGTYLEKRAYVRKIIDYYRKVLDKHAAIQGGASEGEIAAIDARTLDAEF